jgi:hypothetical protein
MPSKDEIREYCSRIEVNLEKMGRPAW